MVRRWWPDRPLVAVADSTYAALDFLAGCRRATPNPITVVTRLRLDAALYEPAPPRRLRQTGRPRLKGQRLPSLATVATAPTTVWTSVDGGDWYGAGERTVDLASDQAVWSHSGLPPVPLRWVLIRDPRGRFATQALLCTDQAAAPEQIVAWFVQRWQLEVTFEEARRHLGGETQRQWSEPAIHRTTPALLGPFSLVTLAAHQRLSGTTGWARHAAWYQKATPTFADALAAVRRELRVQSAFCTSPRAPDTVKVPRQFVERLTDTLCYAA